jgi:hypothetical protein
MCGRPTLWVPGTDHAGIATQLVVEKQLAAEGLTRQALGREKFVERVWEWKEEYGGRITTQIRRLGASCDWEKESFTLSPQLNESVNEAFCRLHAEGLIYRGTYMVNWSPSLQTAVSDLEVRRTRVWVGAGATENGPCTTDNARTNTNCFVRVLPAVTRLRSCWRNWAGVAKRRREQAAHPSPIRIERSTARAVCVCVVCVCVCV